MTMMIRGVRGATTVHANDAAEILAATQELLHAMIDTNGIEEEQVASVFFTTTPDLTAVFPAQAARSMGWTRVALMRCASRASWPGLPRRPATGSSVPRRLGRQPATSAGRASR